MAKPTKPSHVKIDKLKEVLADLQDLQEDVQNPRPGSWDKIGTDITADLKQGDKGLQLNGAEQAGKRYADNVFWINRSWKDIQTGIGTLVQLIQNTINEHEGTDTATADKASQTNTSQSPTSPAGKE